MSARRGAVVTRRHLAALRFIVRRCIAWKLGAVAAQLGGPLAVA